MQAPMFRVTDLLTPADMRCTVQPADPASNEQQATRVNYIDTDDLNRDLSLAALSYLTHQQTPARWQNRLLPVSDPVVQDALLERPPCRFEQFQLRRFARMTSTGVVNDASGESVASHGAPVRIILDIAHNIRAMEALVVRVHRFFPRRSIRYRLKWCSVLLFSVSSVKISCCESVVAFICVLLFSVSLVSNRCAVVDVLLGWCSACQLTRTSLRACLPCFRWCAVTSLVCIALR